MSLSTYLKSKWLKLLKINLITQSLSFDYEYPGRVWKEDL